MTLTILAAALLTACPAEGDTLALKVESGAKITRSFSIESESELVEMSQTQNGEELPADMMPEMVRTQTTATAWTVVDTIESAEDGVATKFARLFESIEGDTSFAFSMEAPQGMGEGMDESMEETLTSPLVENVVLFEAGDDGLEASLPEDSDLDEEVLDGIEAGIDLAFLLPTEEVSEKDTWEVDASAFQQLMELGGDLSLEADEDGDEDSMLSGMKEMMEDAEEGEEPDFDGAAVLTHGGYREVDGRRVVVIGIEVEMTESLAFSPDMDAMGGDAPEDAMLPSSMEIVNETAYSGEGEMLFDPEAGLIISLELGLELDTNSAQIITMDIPQMGEMEMEMNEADEGKVTISYSASIG